MYTTELELDAAKYQIYLGDYNTNGRFDDFGKVWERELISGDRIWTQGDNFYLTPVDKEMDYYDGQMLGKYLNLKNALFAVSISQIESMLTLTPVTEEVARIELPTDANRISFIGNDAWVMSCLPERTVLAPPGTYRLLDYVLFGDEPTGARWQLTASGTKKSPEITVVAGDIAAYTIGEPFRPTVVVPEWSRKEIQNGMEYANLEMTILGAGKEIVVGLEYDNLNGKTALAMSQESKYRPKEATYKILKSDGEVATQGSFEYG